MGKNEKDPTSGKFAHWAVTHGDCKNSKFQRFLKPGLKPFLTSVTDDVHTYRPENVVIPNHALFSQLHSGGWGGVNLGQWCPKAQSFEI